MKLHVINKECTVGDIRIIGIAASSVFLIGDTQTISQASIFDTPPDAVTVGLVPFAAESTSAI